MKKGLPGLRITEMRNSFVYKKILKDLLLVKCTFTYLMIAELVSFLKKDY